MEHNGRDSKLHLLQLIILWAAMALFCMSPAPSTARNLTEYRVDSPVIVPSGETMTIENSHIAFNPEINGIGITVESDAALIIRDSFVDLSNLPNNSRHYFEKAAISANQNAVVIFDNTEISGADNFTPLGYIGCYSCSMTLRNGSSLRNNRNTGYPLGSGEYQGNILYLTGISSLIIEDSFITGNYVKTSFYGDFTYGVIGFFGGPLTIKNSVISGNYSEGGSIITDYFGQGDVVIENTLIENNTITDARGVIYLNGLKSVPINEGTVFRSNSADSGSCLLLKDTVAEIKDNVEFSGNTSGRSGGAIKAENTDFTIGKSTFANNQCESLGGAIHQNGGTLILNGTVFRENKTNLEGGGICFQGEGSVLTVNDAEFIGNNADNFGGGIALAPGTEAIIYKANFADNTAVQDSGGALVILENAKAVIYGLLSSGNSASNTGGAIANAGQLIIHDRKGAMIYDNNAAQSIRISVSCQVLILNLTNLQNVCLMAGNITGLFQSSRVPSHIRLEHLPPIQTPKARL